ncbi:MAG TPA: polymer-forming cytoskeletal protein [Candidatus Treponema faecavium]|nr:polymer-forming cytoskeletal protein [Candidatus Treponema faecavium]
MADKITVCGPETEFDGIMEFKTSLVIMGKFNGTIRSGGSLQIDKTGVCTVDTMSAQDIIIAGSVTGDVHAERYLEMRSGSTVHGNVSAARLRICDNVDFEGQVTMIDTDRIPDIFSMNGEEYKESLLTAHTEHIAE